MKKIILGLGLALSMCAAQAAESVYLFDFIGDERTGELYRTLIEDQNFPDWVSEGGTSTPSDEVTINGVRYLAISGCKPHECPFEAIAILYSPERGDIHGVFSEHDFKTDQQKLTWLNLDKMSSDVMRKVLFVKLYGGVE